MRLLVLTALFLLCSLNCINAQEKIYSFHSNIDIQKDGSVWVTEKIEVDVMGIEIKKGIYRDIPLNFKLPEGRVRQVLTVQSAMRDGKPEPFKTEMIEGGIRIYMGSSDENVPVGTRLYELSYALDRTVYCTDEVCKVMWNVNGNHWKFPIDSLSATISTPEHTEILKIEGWTGGYGKSDEKDFVTHSLGNGKQVFMTNELSLGSNLTISVAFNDEVMSEVSSVTKATYFFRDHSVYLIGGIGLVISFLINFILWAKFGKDPRKGTIIPQFYPPKDWSPAEVLYLLNEGKKDNNMFAAQLLQLAVKGHIKIEKKDTDNKKDSFLISYTGKSTKRQKLTELEQGFLDKLLGIAPQTTISDSYNHRVAAANKFLVTQLEKKQAGLYFNKNWKLILPQYLFPVLTTIGMIVAQNFYEGPVWFIFLLIALLIIMNVIFLRLFYQPTKEGRKMLDHILGLERYIKYADELRINAINKPDMNFEIGRASC